jgi:hypothetical protein
MSFMKHSVAPACVLALALLAAMAPAEDKTKAINSDKTKEMLDKLVGEAKKAAGKIKEEDKAGSLWSRSKETMALPQAEFLKRAESALKTMDTEIKALAEAEGAVSGRDYFKMHVESLKQHLDYCKQEGEKLKTSDSEETFRVKQKKFDRTLGFLADNIQLAKEEAGL